MTVLRIGIQKIKSGASGLAEANSFILPEIVSDFSEVMTQVTAHRKLVVDSALKSNPDIKITCFFLRQKELIEAVRNDSLDIVIVGSDELVDHELAFGLHCVHGLEDSVRGLTPTYVESRVISTGLARSTFAISSPAETPLADLSQLEGQTIATSLKHLAAEFLDRQGVRLADEPMEMSGSVEAAPKLYNVRAIADLVDSGKTALANGLSPFVGKPEERNFAFPILHAEALVLRSAHSVQDSWKRAATDDVFTRIKAALALRKQRQLVQQHLA